MYRYFDEIEVSKIYYEFFSASADRKDKSYWKQFIPHEDMRNLLAAVFDGIERKMDPHSIWLHGTYGTGKTHALFLLKHLLEDSSSEIDSYLDANQESLANIPQRLRAIRQGGDGIVVFCSGSSHLTSTRRLYLELQTAIKNQLKEAGYKTTYKTVVDDILDKISSNDSIINWSSVFKRHRATKLAEFVKPDEVVESLREYYKNPSKSRISLVEKVADILEEEGITLQDNPEKIQQWIKSIIEINELKYLVVMWDEFTDYFNVTSAMTGLQELAHLTTEVPFYLVLATHRAPKQVSTYNKDNWKKLIDRFTRIPYSMQPVTSYKLMAQSIKMKENCDIAWDQRRNSLWAEVKNCANHIIEQEGIETSIDSIQGLIPIHPYAAYLVSKISSQFSSSQRTLFKFLLTKEKGTFLEFIEDFPSDTCKWYTTERLWDYYFQMDTEGLSEGFKQVVSYVSSRRSVKELPESTQRVFKGIMTLIALSKEIANSEGVAATMTNLRWLFYGTNVSSSLNNDLDRLSDMDLIRQIQESATKVTLTIPTTGINPGKIKEYSEKQSFSLVASPTGEAGKAISKMFHDNTVLEKRLVVSTVSAEDILRKRRRNNKTVLGWQINTIYIIIRNAKELDSINNRMSSLTEQFPENLYLLPQAVFTDSRWSTWCDNKARERWYGENGDSANGQHHQGIASRLIKEWFYDARKGEYVIYYRGSIMHANAITGVKWVISEEVVSKKYFYRSERISTKSTLYTTGYGQATAAEGLKINKVSGTLASVRSKIESDDMWPASCADLTKYEKNPDHVLTAMHNVIETAFTGKDTISLNGIWSKYKKEPFGLIPSKIGIFLFGFVLAPYVDGYHYSDGKNTFPLERTKLASIIKEVMGNGKEYQISRTSLEESEFCRLICGVFDLDNSKAKYSGVVQTELRNTLRQMGFPLWVLKSQCENATTVELIEYLVSVCADTSKDSSLLSISTIKEKLLLIKRGATELEECFTSNQLRSGMEEFIENSSPGLLSFVLARGLSIHSLLGKIKKLLQGEVWLWQEDQVSAILLVVAREMKTQEVTYLITGCEVGDLAQARAEIKKRVRNTKLPELILGFMADDNINELLNEVYQFAFSEAMLEEKVIDRLRDNSKEIKALFNDSQQAFYDWCKIEISESVTKTETDIILEDMAEMCQEHRKQLIVDNILNQVSKIKRQKNILTLRNSWKEITNTESPAVWHQENKMPMKWIMGDRLHQLIDAINAPENLSESQVNSAIHELKNNSAGFAVLKNISQCSLNVLDSIIGGYSEWASECGLVDQVISSILSEYSGDIRWNRNELRKKLEAIREKNYEAHTKSKVINLVKQTNTENMQSILLKLSDNPRVGLILMDLLSMGEPK